MHKEKIFVIESNMDELIYNNYNDENLIYMKHIYTNLEKAKEKLKNIYDNINIFLNSDYYNYHIKEYRLIDENYKLYNIYYFYDNNKFIRNTRLFNFYFYFLFFIFILILIVSFIILILLFY